MATDSLNGRGHPVMGRGDRHLLVYGDGLQLGATGPQCGDVGEVLAKVAVEADPTARDEAAA